MAQLFNPWATPPESGALTGDLASFEINDMPSPDGPSTEDSNSEAEADSETVTEGAEDQMMQQALAVISQQADLIAKLMKTLGK